MASENLKSAFDAPFSAKDTPGTSMEKFDTSGNDGGNLKSAASSVAFMGDISSGIDLDIPGNLMTCYDPPELSGNADVRSSQGTTPVGK